MSTTRKPTTKTNSPAVKGPEVTEPEVVEEVLDDEVEITEIANKVAENSADNVPANRVICRLDPEQQQQVDIRKHLFNRKLQKIEELRAEFQALDIEAKIISREVQLSIIESAAMQGFDELDKNAYYDVNEHGQVILLMTPEEMAARAAMQPAQ